MPRKDIEFKTSDGVTLRGWFYTPASTPPGKLPCVVLSHGWCAVKEMDLDAFAEYFTSHLPLTALVYDNRGFGASDHKDGSPRLEIIPREQQSDISDAITFAQSLEGVDPEKIAIWGSSYSGGHVLYVGAVDRRVKAVLCQVPMVDGWENFHRLVRCDMVGGMNQMFAGDRQARMAGKEATVIPIVDEDPMKPSALPTADSYEFFSEWFKKIDIKNAVTLRSVEMLRGNHPSHLIHRISPTPLLMTISENDTLAPTDIAIEAYSRAREPKELHILPGGHFEGYAGPNFEKNAGRQLEFLKRHLCS